MTTTNTKTDPTEPENAVLSLRALHAQLVQRHEEIDTRLVVLARSRGALAFAASCGDADALRADAIARGQMDDLMDDQQRLALAIEEAGRRIEAAEAIEQQATRRERVRQAQALLPSVREDGAAMRAAINEFARRYRDFQAKLDRARELGAPIPNSSLIRVNARRATETALGGLRLLDILPPSQRLDLEAWLTAMTDTAAEWCEHQLAQSPDATTRH